MSDPTGEPIHVRFTGSHRAWHVKLPVDTPPVSSWQRVGETVPSQGTWCWVWDGLHVMLAVREQSAAGGWGNGDTWEDFGRAVTHWQAIREPEPPIEDITHE